MSALPRIHARTTACATTNATFAFARTVAFALVMMAAFAPRALAAAPELQLRGHVLAIERGYVVFTTGDALRLRAGTAIPKGTTIGSDVRVAIDTRTHDVTFIQLAPHADVAGEIDIANVPRDYVVVSAQSAPLAAVAGKTAGANAKGPVTITLEVTVPANTPPTDDVYVATDRSNYGPAEIRMQRLSARRFTVSIGLPGNTKLKYEYTRGNYASVERDRSGGIVIPHSLDVTPNAKTDDSVARWADLT